jgi:hypothetical protein
LARLEFAKEPMTERLAGFNTTKDRTAPASLSPRRAPSYRGTSKSLLLLATLLISAACSDAATAPGQPQIDAAAVARVMPSVLDARTRLAPSIENVTVRERVVFDLQELESALNAGDAQKVRFHVRVTGNLLSEYVTGRTLSLKEGPDVSWIALMLYAVSEIVDAGFDLAAFDSR